MNKIKPHQWEQILVAITIIVIATIASCNAQIHQNKDEMISLIVTQDNRLLLFDDDRGNKPVTADIRATMLLKGNQKELGNLEIRLGFEYADLYQAKYLRYSGGIGYSFNYMILPATDYKYAIAPFINYGIIVRESNIATTGAIEFGADIKFPITKRIKIVSTIQWTHRNDLKSNNFRINIGTGIEFIIL